MRAVKELKKHCLLMDVPLVLVRDILLGWRRSCFAVPGKPIATVATFGAWLADAGVSRLKKVLQASGHKLDDGGCLDGPTMPSCRLTARLRIDGSWALVEIVMIDVIFQAVVQIAACVHWL
ncbi:unnamed protein product [Symbiodinium natans]|uniref:Uncharacterized protein n=1 Tax=Symbiodinium natans TaxID=878477 RepID=A0A812HM72_9DINO|nr:unnamed protein product [Symbiodinium natans]